MSKRSLSSSSPIFLFFSFFSITFCFIGCLLLDLARHMSGMMVERTDSKYLRYDTDSFPPLVPGSLRDGKPFSDTIPVLLVLLDAMFCYISYRESFEAHTSVHEAVWESWNVGRQRSSEVRW